MSRKQINSWYLPGSLPPAMIGGRRRRKRQRGKGIFDPVRNPGRISIQRGAGFLDDFVTGFKMPFQLVNKVVPLKALATVAGGPLAGAAAGMLGLGKRRAAR